MYEIFGKYGAIRQIRVGSTKETRGTAYVVYEDIFDAKNAVDHLSGFNVQVPWVLALLHGVKEAGLPLQRPPGDAGACAHSCVHFRRGLSRASSTAHHWPSVFTQSLDSLAPPCTLVSRLHAHTSFPRRTGT